MVDHTKPIRQLLEQYGTDPEQGLSGAKVLEHLATYGENQLESRPPHSYLKRFLSQFQNVMVLILLAAAVFSFAAALFSAAGEFLDSIIIIAIVVLNAALGAMQEGKAEKAMEALRELSAPTAKVLRSGATAAIPASQVVPGDIAVLEAGDRIPADGRLLISAGLQCEESALTGESLPVVKDSQSPVPHGASLGDRRNMVYAGCLVTYGRGTALITRTGMETELGKIASLLESEPSVQTPLQQKLGSMGKTLGLIAVGICALVFVFGLLQDMSLGSIFLTAVSLAVAAIPEGLTTVVTVVLALGVQRMVRQNAIIRRLPAVETLGSASVICSDKTGTLTQNRMTVQQLWSVGGEVEAANAPLSAPAQQLLRLGVLCSDGSVEEVDGVLRHIGDPTETAIVAAAREHGIFQEQAHRQAERIGEIPFDSDRKRMTTVHRVGERILCITKGGFDVLLPLCGSRDTTEALQVNQTMGENALRVLGVACRELRQAPERYAAEDLEQNLTFVGLIGMIDPPREESSQAVALCQKAGIRTVMITGDHATTASAIARQLGILERDSQTLEGAELAGMTDDALDRNVERYRVYARVSPQDKIRIVKAWQRRGAVVAMTGDGVNDAPALKAADIGCAMGIAGTAVAKGAADMILTDDNFSTIVDAVRGGRVLYNNITKTVQFLLGSNLGEVFAVLIAMLLGWGSPLLPIHLLLVNLITYALPALALGVEPEAPSLMERPPLPREQGIFSGGLGLLILLQGFLIGMLTLAGYAVGRFFPLSAYHPPSPQAGMTMAFLVLSLSQLVQAYNCRSRSSLFHTGFLSNPSLNKASLVSATIVLAICLFPSLESLFHMVDLSMRHWLWVITLAIFPLVIAEAVKLGAWLFLRPKRPRS